MELSSVSAGTPSGATEAVAAALSSISGTAVGTSATGATATSDFRRLLEAASATGASSGTSSGSSSAASATTPPSASASARSAPVATPGPPGMQAVQARIAELHGNLSALSAPGSITTAVAAYTSAATLGATTATAATPITATPITATPITATPITVSPTSAPATAAAHVHDHPVVAPAAATGGDGMLWPVQGGSLTDSYHPHTGSRSHKGVDIGAPTGTPIKAAAGGTVTYAGWNDGGYGNLVIIRHPDGKETYYAHQSQVRVSVGDSVAAGQHIGDVGSTGRSTGPHLHFEVRINGQQVDPHPYIT